jgi:hypothetical protein
MTVYSGRREADLVMTSLDWAKKRAGNGAAVVWQLRSQKERGIRTNSMFAPTAFRFMFCGAEYTRGGPSGDGDLARLPEIQHCSGSRGLTDSCCW